MRNLDLKKLWGSDMDSARDHFDSLEDPEAIARRRSKNILHTIRRYMLIESVISTIVLAAFNVAFWFWDKNIFWAYLAFCILSMIISTWVYLRYNRNLKKVNQQDVRTALQQYIRHTAGYIKRLKVIIYFITPVGYYAGFSAVILPDLIGDPLKMYLLVYGIGSIGVVPSVFAVVWLVNKKYIPWLYGRHLNAFQDALKQLENG